MTAFGVDTKGGALRCFFWVVKDSVLLFGVYCRVGMQVLEMQYSMIWNNPPFY